MPKRSSLEALTFDLLLTILVQWREARARSGLAGTKAPQTEWIRRRDITRACPLMDGLVLASGSRVASPSETTERSSGGRMTIWLGGEQPLVRSSRLLRVPS